MGTRSSAAPTTRRPTARIARVATGVLSLLVLASALVGLPLLLAWATPVLWETGHDDLAHLLDRQDTGTTALLLIACVSWIGWAQFTYCTVRELVAQLRGRTWHAPRGMGSSQRAAALLIGSILVLLPTSSALASDAQAAPAATADRVPAQAQAAHDTGTATARTSTADTSSPTYTVRQTRPAESLWSIAEQELGDGEQWRQIAALNEGHTMTDGQVFRSHGFLQPGWQLTMPASYSPAGGAHTQLGQAAPAAAGEPAHVEVVEPGDSLSKIAAQELGDGNRWPEVFKASKTTSQPHGMPTITDPDVIYPGQHVLLPGTTSEPDTPPPTSDPSGEDEQDSLQPVPPDAEGPDDGQQPGQDKEGAQSPAPSPSTTPAPEPSASTTPSSKPTKQPDQEQEQEQGPPPAIRSTDPGPSSSGTPSAAPSPPSPEVSASATASSPDATTPGEPGPAGNTLDLRTVLGAGALLAASVTGALAVRRTLQRRRRKPGEKIAIAAETSAAEAQLAAAAEAGGEAGGAVRLDLALRTLAHQLSAADDSVKLPQLRAARIGTHTLAVLPEDLTQEPVAPFVSGAAGWWVLPDDADLLDQEAARAVPAPYPGLVTLGSTDTGDLLLCNLAALPALLLDGSAVHITEVCTSLALELGMSPWASDVEIVTIGFGEDLPQLLPTARIAHMRHPAHALRDLSERMLEARQIPDSQDQPYLLLCASSLDADTAWQFAELIDKAGPIPVTLIAPASSAAAHFPQAEILNASLHTPQHLAHTGTDITVQRLEHTAYQQITTALAVSGQPAHPAQGPWQDVPGEPDKLPQPTRLAPATSDASPTPAATADVLVPQTMPDADATGGVFAALIAASADPSALHLLPAASASASASGSNKPRPDTEGTPPAAAEPPSGEEAAGTDGHKDGPENGKEPTAAEDTAQDLRAPEIRVLGPVEVDGVAASGHGPRSSQLAALLFFRPGRSADVLCADMDPLTPWSVSTLNSRLRGLRSALGSDPSGHPYVPRRSTGEDPYRLSPAVRCDWTQFLQLAEHALPQGPAGVPDLEKALSLVRGRPFGSRPLPWAEPYQQEMITRIIDVAHAVATHRTSPGPHHNLSAARRAVVIGLGADDSAELLYRDLMRIEHTAGNRSGLHTAITRVQQVNQALDCCLETDTENLIRELLNTSGTTAPSLK